MSIEKRVAERFAAEISDAELRKLRAAYNIAQDIVEGTTTLDLTNRTQTLAKKFFNLVDKSGTPQQRVDAARELMEQLDVELDYTKKATKVLENWVGVVSDATGIYENHLHDK